MATTSRLIHADPRVVWEVLADGWLYPLWVVGASRMREVDGHWPQTGAKLHHSVGSWPLLLDDDTEVLDVTPGESLTLRAKGRPTGEAKVHIELVPEGAETRVSIHEDAMAGPARLIPKPIRDLGLTWRNKESLSRLAYIAERRPNDDQSRPR